MSTTRGLGVKAWAVLTIALMLISNLGTWKYAEATLPTQDGTWGQWIREAYGWFTSELTLPFATNNKLLTVDALGNVTSTSIDVGSGDDLLNVDDLTVGNLTLTGPLDANGQDITGVDDMNATDAYLSNLYANTATLSGLTNGRLATVGAGGLITDDGGLTYNSATNTLTVGNLTVSGDWYNGTVNVSDLIDHPESEADFIVWGEPAAAPIMYHAKNGHTGQISYNSTSLVHGILQPINDANPAGGIKIVVKSGAYTWENTWNVTRYHIDFSMTFGWHDSSHACFNIAPGFAGEAMNITGPGAYFHEFGFKGQNVSTAILSSSLECKLIDIEIDEFANGLQIDSEYGDYQRIVVDNCGAYGVICNSGTKNSLFRVISGWNGYGFKINSGFTPLNTFTDCHAEHTDFDWTINADHNIYSGCNSLNSGGYAFALGGASQNIFQNIKIVNPGRTTHTDAALWLVSIGGVHCINNAFTNIQITTDGSTSFAYGIKEEDANQDYNTYSNGILLNAGTANMLPQGAHTKLVNIIGYITESSGTATILNATTSIAFAHGLSATPSASWFSITFTENPTNPTGNWWLTCNATHAILNVAADPGASNLDFSWQARKP